MDKRPRLCALQAKKSTADALQCLRSFHPCFPTEYGDWNMKESPGMLTAIVTLPMGFAVSDDTGVMHVGENNEPLNHFDGFDRPSALAYHNQTDTLFVR